MHYYNFNISDFNNSTRHLTLVERALYVDAINLYYDTELPLTTDIDVLSRRLMARTDDEKEALIGVLDEYFILDDDGFRHARCDVEINKYHSKIEANSKAGKASAAARAARKKRISTKGSPKISNKVSTGVERALSERGTDEVPTNNQETITNNQEPNKSVSLFDPENKLLKDLDLAVWKTWIEYRKKIKKPPYKTDNAALKLARYSADIQAQAVQEAMDAEWTGFFPESVKVAKETKNSMTGTYAAAKKFMDEPLPPEKKRLS
jgi:uncharacterized protein YdaU (DUF1376 family)